MMRKYLSILLALCLILSIVGCSNSAPAENEKKSIHFELLPEDADLSAASGVIVEPKEAPYNLGGWTAESIVFWDVELSEDGQYAFKITYSRPGQYPMARGILRVETADGKIHDLNFHADPTGKNKNVDDWTVYVTKDEIGDNLTAGTARISVIPNFEPSEDMPEHFINLRSIEVTCKPDLHNYEEVEPQDAASSTEDEQAVLENTYKIMIDGKNVTENMNIIMYNDNLYAEASSYFDALTYNDNPILYCEYNQDTGVIDVYSWATDVMIMYFNVGANFGYRLVDVMNDEWDEIKLDAEIYIDSEDNALIPVKAMTEYLTSSGNLEADIKE